ncbi:MAG: phage terminase large subunit, partial [Nitrosopumilus sp.]
MILEFTAKQEEAFKKIQSEMFNFILYGGAIRGGKTWWGLSSLLILCEIFPGSRWCIIRQDSERIRTTTIPSFNKIDKRGILKQSPYEYTHHNGSVILFKGENYSRDKELDWMKGLEVNGFLFEEINECQETTLNKAFERAGSWIIPQLNKQPKPIILATCNPSNGWIKERVYDKWKNGTLPETYCYIPAKITDNPHLPEEYIESLKNLPKYEYMVFVQG